MLIGLRDAVIGLHVVAVRLFDWLSGSTRTCLELHAAHMGMQPRMCQIPSPLPGNIPYLKR